MPEDIAELRENAWKAFRGWHIFLIRRRNEILQHMETDEIKAYYASRPDYFHPPRNTTFQPERADESNAETAQHDTPDDTSPDTSHGNTLPAGQPAPALYRDPAFADFDAAVFRSPAEYSPYLERLRQLNFPLPEPLIPIPLPADDVAHGIMHAGFYRYTVQPAHDDLSHVALLLGWSHNFLVEGYENMDPVKVTLMKKQIGLSPVFYRLNGDSIHHQSIWLYELGRVPDTRASFLHRAADMLNRLSAGQNMYDPTVCMDTDRLAHIRTEHRVLFYAIVWTRCIGLSSNLYG